MSSTGLSRTARRFGAMLVGLGCLALIVGSALGVQRAQAILQEVKETGLPGYLSLRSAPGTPEWKELTPGTTVHWLIEASLDTAVTSTLDLEMRSSGSLVDLHALDVEVTTCTSMFATTPDLTFAQCPESANVVVPKQPLGNISSEHDGTVFALAPLNAEAPRFVLVSLTVPASASGTLTGGEEARIGVGFTASGDDPQSPAGDPPPLAVTGADYAALSFLSLGILVTGIGLVLLRRRHGMPKSEKERP